MKLDVPSESDQLHGLGWSQQPTTNSVVEVYESRADSNVLESVARSAGAVLGGMAVEALRDFGAMTGFEGGEGFRQRQGIERAIKNTQK